MPVGGKTDVDGVGWFSSVTKQANSPSHAYTERSFLSLRAAVLCGWVSCVCIHEWTKKNTTRKAYFRKKALLSGSQPSTSSSKQCIFSRRMRMSAHLAVKACKTIFVGVSARRLASVVCSNFFFFHFYSVRFIQRKWEKLNNFRLLAAIKKNIYTQRNQCFRKWVCVPYTQTISVDNTHTHARTRKKKKAKTHQNNNQRAKGKSAEEKKNYHKKSIDFMCVCGWCVCVLEGDRFVRW